MNLKTFLVLLPLIFLFGCLEKKEILEVKKTLKINFQDGDLPSTHPHIAIDYRMRSLQAALFEGLTRMDAEGAPQPAAACTIQLSPCQTQYTFTLRPLTWSNGEPVTAYQFESAWKRAMEKNSPCRRADLFYLIKNAEKIKKGELGVQEAGVRAIDAETLFVELEHPAPYFLELISNPIFSPLADQKEEPILFNGPFLIDQWKRDEFILLKRNPQYWDAKSVALDQIEILFITDPLTTVQLFEKGELDWIGSPFSCFPADMVPTFQASPLFKTKEVARIYWLYCNHEVFPFNNATLRKALSLAIDRKGIVEHVLLAQKAATTPLPSSLTLLTQECLAEGANALLAKHYFKQCLNELGLTEETFPPITLSHSHITGQRQLAEIIQSDWQKNLGLKVLIEGSEWNMFFSDLTRGKYQIGGCLKSALFRDPIYHLELLQHKSHPYNVSRWEDATYVSLLEKARCSTNEKERKQFLQDAEAILLEEMPVIPIYSEVYLYLISPHIEGVVIHDLGHVDFKWIRLAQG